MKKFGWIPDLPDKRDWVFPAYPRAIALPPKVDLSPLCGEVQDQENIGSCTGHGVGGLVRFNLLKQNIRTAFLPSRLMLYFNGRSLEGTTDQDAGAMIRDVIKGLAKYGVCPEEEWPYITSRFDRRPPFTCYNHGKAHQAIQYRRVPQTVEAMKQCLFEGFPFTFGFSVYESIDTSFTQSTGKIRIPKPSEQLLGGHCVYANGYDDNLKVGSEKGAFVGPNSWGTAWGKRGYFVIPYRYLTDPDLAADFWTVRKMEVDT